ncbi:MAG: HEAT repeat domain-containing protein [Verrucomicrobia bacterium]|nr:HEAT repeat domain-containing protein [Verrucomicrobiota bacterium]
MPARLAAACVLITSLILLAIPHAPAAEEDNLIAALRSSASAARQWDACEALRRVGTARAVPALAALLDDERASHAARHALEGLPCPEAGAALQAALNRTAGLVKAGLIDSLGRRAEPAARPFLLPLLSDPNPTIAAATAAALGRIGGAEALAALTAARGRAPSAVQPAVLESLLQCAERLLQSGDAPGAAAAYRGLLNAPCPAVVRAAAWRGLALCDAAGRGEIVLNALRGGDRPIRMAAIQLLRELDDTRTIQACLRQWPSLAADAQLAVLDAQVRLGANPLPTVRSATASPHPALRAAAWRALGDLQDPSSLPALANAAAQGDPLERDAARESLARVRGPGMRDAILAHLGKADPLAKAELLRALGERGDRDAAATLVEHAGADAEPVRLAALESLRRLAVEQTVTPLLDLAARSASDAARAPILKALYAVCQGTPDKDRTARGLVHAMERLPNTQRRHVLPLLAELGTPPALASAQTASLDSDLELAREAVRVLARWPNSAPAAHLLELARGGADTTLRTLALRGGIDVAGHEPDPARRLTLLRQARATATQTPEKRQALGQLARIPTREALDEALKDLNDPALVNEAALAAIHIAESLAPADPKFADGVAVKVLARCQTPDIVRRAWALRLVPGSGASFIRDWQVCGPYRQEGAVGAQAVFDIPFGPENAGHPVDWRPVPRTEHVNLLALFPNASNCAAYLRAHILASQACEGALLMGSDDGIKAWLNGDVVHSHNVDRGEVPDQDVAPVRLKQGANLLMLKITQGGGGWSASARFVGADAKPIPGLTIEPAAGK